MEKSEFKNVSNYSFEDLFDLEKIQKLQDAFCNAMGIGMTMVAPDGRVITQGSTVCDFCTRVVRSTECGRMSCKESDAVLGRPNKDGPIIERCGCAGLLDAGASIMVGDTHVASWLMGQVQDADQLLSEEENKVRAARLGIDPEIYCKEIAKVPKIKREQFERFAWLIYTMANQLSELGINNYMQKEELSYRRELERQLLHSSQHDPLTNLYNRMFYDAKISELIKEDVSPVSVIVADVNYLKLSNDIFGHTEGDCLLQQISSAMLEEGKPEYIVCRCGGDEFYILMPHAGSEEALDYAERLRKRCISDYRTVLPPSLAIGLDTRYSSHEQLVNVIKHAEDRMYQDKHRIKSEGKILDVIREILYGTGYLTRQEEIRTRQIAMAFAGYLKLDPFTVENLERLLDIQYLGLIVVPQETLKAANNFIDYELEVRYGITEIEYRLAKMFDSSLPIAGIVVQRFEQWNGNGRPHQLHGEQLDFLTRFIAVTNWYALLTGKRPHGFNRTREYALVRLAEQAGTVLEPAMVNAFLNFMKTEESQNKTTN